MFRSLDFLQIHDDYGLNCIPQEDVEVSLPVCVNKILFENRAFK